MGSTNAPAVTPELVQKFPSTTQRARGTHSIDLSVEAFETATVDNNVTKSIRLVRGTHHDPFEEILVRGRFFPVQQSGPSEDPGSNAHGQDVLYTGCLFLEEFQERWVHCLGGDNTCGTESRVQPQSDDT